MLLLGLDFETTGLEPKTHHIIEVGVVTWDTDTQTPLRLLSFYVKAPTWVAEAEKIHGIKQETVEKYGVAPAAAFARLSKELDGCEYIVAHNGNIFDKLFAEEECRRQGIKFWPQPWLDTTIDIEYPPHITASRKLVHLAAEHGFLNPFAHRAVFDVLTMFKVLSCYDINEVVRYSKVPWVTLQALVGFNNNKLAKDRSYRWNPDRKIWWRSVKTDKLEQERKDAPFETKIIETVVQ